MKIQNPYIPTDRQRVAHLAPQRYKLFGGAMGGGKSRWLCEEVKELCMEYPGNRALMARYHLSDFKNTTLKTLEECFPVGLKVEHNKSERSFRFPNGSEILYVGLSEETDIAKLKSMELGVFAMDEASEIPKEQFLLACSRLRRILPSGKKPQYFGILTSNPEDCWLRDTFVGGKGGKDFIFIPSLPTDNPHLPHDYVDRLRDIYPEDWVRRFLEGSWDELSAGDTVIPRDWVNDSVNKEIPREMKPVIGADIARFGDDETVLYYGEGNKLVDYDIYIKKGLDETVSRIIRLARKNDVQRIITDDIGLGGGVTDFLVSMGEPVEGMNVGRKAYDDRFFNLKAELWWHARDLFREGKVSILDDEKLTRQLAGVKFRYRNTGKIIVEPKIDTKKRIGMSPDRADAFVLMLWASKGIQDLARDFNRGEINEDDFDPYGWESLTAKETRWQQSM